MHGADDPINAPEGSRAFHEACGHPDATLRLYPGARHEVHHDVGRVQFERDLLRWLRERSMRAEVPPPRNASPGPLPAARGRS
jgi:alpha-beta hydrolase superfamily lysophospholipase